MSRRGDIFYTSDKARIDIVACSPAVRPHAIVLFSEAPTAVRTHALEQLRRIAKANNQDSESATAVLKQFEELGLDVEEHISAPALTSESATALLKQFEELEQE
jgi:hypothetical protein